jgi:FkbH-like protein
MVLKLEDFATWRIDWKDKAENIRELMAGLNLGLDAAVFLDDSGFERARVREALPQVSVPELPADPTDYPSFLAGLRYFDNPHLSAEDRERTSMYVADRQRKALKSEGLSLGDWLRLLELRVVVESLNEANLERATQLLNKTNQLNLSTRRLTPPELLAWSREGGHRLWTFRTADKFGDYGLCGIASLSVEDARARLMDFLLSCRVMGRGVEESMLATAAQQARAAGCEELVAEFVPTARNQPCHTWFQNQSNMRQDGTVFRLSLATEPVMPAHVQVAIKDTDEEILIPAGN